LPVDCFERESVEDIANRRGANRGGGVIQARRRSKPVDDDGLSRVFFDARRGF